MKRGVRGAVPKRPPLSEADPEIAAEAMFEPATVVAGSAEKMLRKCTAHEHKWKASVVRRTGVSKSGCIQWCL